MHERTLARTHAHARTGKRDALTLRGKAGRGEQALPAQPAPCWPVGRLAKRCLARWRVGSLPWQVEEAALTLRAKAEEISGLSETVSSLAANLTEAPTP